MTQNPVCCNTTDQVNQAAHLMHQQDVGSIPVIDQQNKRLVGIVTDRDIALKVVGENRHPQNTRVEEVMTRNPVTCRPDDDLNTTLNAMSHRQIRRVPVIDEQGKVVGIISQADVALRTDDEQKTAQVVEGISRPTA
jgi:CBS domain-containing protein